jgi:hypothetical protein
MLGSFEGERPNTAGGDEIYAVSKWNYHDRFILQRFQQRRLVLVIQQGKCRYMINETADGGVVRKAFSVRHTLSSVDSCMQLSSIQKSLHDMAQPTALCAGELHIWHRREQENQEVGVQTCIRGSLNKY